MRRYGVVLLCLGVAACEQKANAPQTPTDVPKAAIANAQGAAGDAGVTAGGAATGDATAAGGAAAGDATAAGGAAWGDATAAVGPAGGDAAPGAGAAKPRMMGAVSEDEFRAMHQLRADTPAQLFGKDIIVGGSRAYLSLPPGMSAPMPAVVLVHEWWGLNDHIRMAADRLAAAGMAALAVDLYGGNVATTPEQAQQYMKSIDPESAKKVLKAAFDYLKDAPEIKATKRGAIGWCMGGGYALTMALIEPHLDADVVYYGFVPTDEKSLKPLKAPLLAFFGTQDKSIPKEKVDAFEATLKKLKKNYTIERVDAGHAFANPSGPSYNSEVAKAAWAETLKFFHDKLGAIAEPPPSSSWTAPVGVQGAEQVDAEKAAASRAEQRKD